MAEGVRAESTRYGLPCPTNLSVEVGLGFGMGGEEEEEDVEEVPSHNPTPAGSEEQQRPTHGAKGALLHVDAPRRALFRHYRLVRLPCPALPCPALPCPALPCMHVLM